MIESAPRPTHKKNRVKAGLHQLALNGGLVSGRRHHQSGGNAPRRARDETGPNNFIPKAPPCVAAGRVAQDQAAAGRHTTLFQDDKNSKNFRL